MTLAALLPRLLPQGSGEASFHVMDFSGEVNERTIHRDGMMTIALGGDDTRVIHAKLEPIVDTTILLRPLAYFFVPTFDAYFDADSSHRCLSSRCRSARLACRTRPCSPMRSYRALRTVWQFPGISSLQIS
jgi:hypothetical protein